MRENDSSESIMGRFRTNNQTNLWVVDNCWAKSPSEVLRDLISSLHLDRYEKKLDLNLDLHSFKELPS